MMVLCEHRGRQSQLPHIRKTDKAGGGLTGAIQDRQKN
jgi:hypothetical protein